MNDTLDEIKPVGGDSESVTEENSEVSGGYIGETEENAALGGDTLGKTEGGAPLGRALDKGGSKVKVLSSEDLTPDRVAQLLSEDIASLSEEFSELSGIESITELQDPTRYAALRDLGLTPREAYLATAERSADTRAHLRSPVPKSLVSSRSAMTHGELCQAREIFEGLSDAEIESLYKRVTK